MNRLFIVAAGVLVLFGAPAWGQGSGLLNAVAYKPLTAGSTLAVSPLDNSDQNLRLQVIFENELRARGFIVSSDAALVLTFETRSSPGIWTDGGSRRIIELSDRRDQAGVEAPRVQLNLYNSLQGGVFNAGRPGTNVGAPGQYRLDATINDRRSGERLWQGWATAPLIRSDGITLSMSMVPVMVGSVGTTVKRKPFDLP
jgi:hypothetical protein